jgi:hypothetical protein
MTFETDSEVKNFLTTDRTVPVVRRLRGCEHFIKRKTIKCVEFVMSDQSLIARGDADVAIPVPPAMRLPSASGFGGRQTIARAILWTLSLFNCWTQNAGFATTPAKRCPRHRRRSIIRRSDRLPNQPVSRERDCPYRGSR